MKSSDEKKRSIEQRHERGIITPEEAARQQKLQAAVEYTLKDFVGKELTPMLIAEAEGKLRETFEELARSGTYRMPPNMWIDRVELGADMRIKVYFKRGAPS